MNEMNSAQRAAAEKAASTARHQQESDSLKKQVTMRRVVIPAERRGVWAEGTNPNLRQDFDNGDKEESLESRQALNDLKAMHGEETESEADLRLASSSFETQEALRDLRDLNATFDDPEVVADRKAIKDKEKNAELEAMSDSVLRTAERSIAKAEAGRIKSLKNAIENMPPSRAFTDEEKKGIKNKGMDIFIDKLKLAYVNALENFDPKLTKGKDNEAVAMILPPAFTLKPWKMRELSKLKDLHNELINAIEESNKSKE